MLASRRKPWILVRALVAILGLSFVIAVAGSPTAGAQGDDDDFNLIGQGGSARIISPVDGEVVDWPFTMIIQADDPDVVWDAEIVSPLHPFDPEGGGNVLEFDENGRAEVRFDGPFPAWALSDDWTSRSVEVYGSSFDPETEETGGFFDDTILRINRPVAVAPVISLDDPDAPIAVPSSVTGTIDAQSQIVDVVIEHDGQVDSTVEFDGEGNFTIDLVSTHRPNVEYIDDDVITVLVRAVDALGGRALEKFDLATIAPELTIDAYEQPEEYPIGLSGTLAHDGISRFPQIFVELDWDDRREVEIQPQISSDGTWSIEFDPRFVQGWVYEPGETLGMSMRFSDNAGRTAEAHTRIVLPPQFLYCEGYGVTVDLLKGDVPTSGADIILGGPVRDVINALGGDDVICSLGGWDIVNGGPGNDTIVAGNGRDRVTGGEGWDTIYGGGGNDDISGGPGRDEVSGGRGNDTIRLGADRDLGVGNEGNDVIYGGTGHDRLFGRIGLDQLYGGGGNDLLVGGVGPDKIFGEAGSDEAYGEAGRDRIDLGGGADIALGGAGDDVILGQAGADRMAGEGGNDTLIGGPQRDYAIGGDGIDVCQTELKEECER